MTNETMNNQNGAPDDDALRQRVREAMEARGLTRRQVADAMGEAYQTFSAWLNGTYNGDNEKRVERARRWLDGLARRDRERSLVPSVPGFVQTRTASRLFAVLEGAQFGPDMGLIAGNAGVGKTMAIEAYAAQNNNVWVITATPKKISPSAILDELAEQQGVQERGTRQERAVLRQLSGSSGLIVVDEAQHLSVPGIEMLRSIHDQAKVGVVLSGNAPLIGKIDGLGRTADHAQIFSRIGHRRNVGAPLQSDVCPILKEWGLDDEDVVNAAKAIAMRDGALRSMTKVLRNAVRIARVHGRESVAIGDMEASWKAHMTGEFPRIVKKGD
ncbi:AAA family ATPase [Gluconacetobacter sacchari]|uniref:AAA family ATPase n=1 Tax=Gluconacetobacter sacchari TaxID=92759 RepID=A0A7W4IC44_9PROT|nr:AAA family ATPase [Gluconacetobacter sacchari]MBB2160115.1 AAA family ATPase [Gluconacetobacter sacchari]